MLELRELKPGDRIFAPDISDIIGWHDQFLDDLRYKNITVHHVTNNHLYLRNRNDFEYTITYNGIDSLLSICFKVVDDKVIHKTFNRIANIMR